MPDQPTLSDLKKKGPPSDNQLITLFKSDPVNTLRQVNLPQHQKERVRLNRLIKLNQSKDPDLASAWQIAQNQLPNLRPKSATLSRKPQPVKTQAIPELIIDQNIVQPAKVSSGLITEKAAPILQSWLNQYKIKYQEFLAEKYSRMSAEQIASQAHGFSQNLWQFTALYRSQLPKHLLSQSAWTFVFSSLGPLGEMMENIYHKNISWTMAWQKNLLNPNAMFYYINSLPSRNAFNLLKHPLGAGFSILAHGGAPLVSNLHYQTFSYNPQTGEKQLTTQHTTVFDPHQKLISASNSLADKIFVPLSGSAKNQQYAQSLEALRQARLSKDKNKINQAKKDLTKLVNQNIGPLQSLRRNLARNLKQSHRDPFSFITVLIGQFIFDSTIGLAANIVRAALTRTVSYIPGVNELRASLGKFFTSNKWLNTFKIGGATTQQFFRGVFSPATASSYYLGYKPIASLFPQFTSSVLNLNIPFFGHFQINLPFAVNPLAAASGTLTAGLGAVYKTAINISNLGLISPNGIITPLGWTERYYNLQSYIHNPQMPQFQRNYQSKLLQQEYFQSGLGRPGFINRFARFLHHNWWLRLPLNGVVLGDLLSPLLAKYLGFTPLQSMLTLGGLDYFWQIKTPLFRVISKYLIKIPFVQDLVASYTQFIRNPIQNFFHKLFYQPGSFQSGFLGKMPTSWTLRPWAQGFKNVFGNFFNPGFFAGFSLVPILQSAGMPLWISIVAGPVLGSSLHLLVNAVSNTLVSKMGITTLTMAKFQSLSWVGYFLGLGAQYIISSAFGLSLPWLPLASSLAFPLIWTLAVHLLPSLGSLGAVLSQMLVSGLSYLIGAEAAAAILSGTFLATVVTIGSLITLTIFTGFVLTSAFQNFNAGIQAGPVSACFQYNSLTVTVTDRQPQYGGRIADIKKELFDNLFERSQQQHPDIKPDEQALFHQSVTISKENQLFKDSSITLDTTIPGPGWYEFMSTDPNMAIYNHSVAFKTLSNTTEEMTITSASLNGFNTVSLSLLLEGPNTIAELSQDCIKYPAACELAQLFSVQTSGQTKLQEQIDILNDAILLNQQEIAVIDYLSPALIDILNSQIPLNDLSGLENLLNNPNPGLNQDILQAYLQPLQTDYNQYQTTQDINQLGSDLQLFLTNLDPKKIELEQQIQEYQQTITDLKSLEAIENESFYSLPANTQINTFLTLIYTGMFAGGPVPTQTIDIFSGVYSGQYFCRANNTITLTLSP